jgi:hypothetical protein
LIDGRQQGPVGYECGASGRLLAVARFEAEAGYLRPPAGCGWMPGVLGESTMNSPKMAVLAYCLAVGFILAVAFHSRAKLLVAADAAPTTASDAK